MEAAGADDAVSTTEPPAQKVVAPPGVIVTTGLGFTVTDRAADPVQPLAVVMVTIYVPAVEGVMAAVVAPVLHIYDTAAGLPLAVSTTEPPAQKVVGPPGVIVVVGLALTVTATAVPDPVQPAPVLTVTL